MRKRLVIIGAGGHGKVVADIAVKNGYEEIVFLDDNTADTECAGFRIAGKTDERDKFEDADCIVAIGNAEIRKKFSEKIKCVTLIHPDAVISRRVRIDEGTVVMAGAVINSDVKIGKGCIINTGATVDHDSVLEDYVHISVGAHLAGNVIVGNETWIGAGATVSNHVNICGNCMIGAGAVVVKDIEKQGVYVGVPVKKIRNM